VQYKNVDSGLPADMLSFLNTKNLYTRIGSQSWDSESLDYSAIMLLDDFCILDDVLWNNNFAVPVNYIVGNHQGFKDKISNNLYGYK